METTPPTTTSGYNWKLINSVIAIAANAKADTYSK
jgi:hypothetical protein